jgi:HEAT repeat protein
MGGEASEEYMRIPYRRSTTTFGGTHVNKWKAGTLLFALTTAMATTYAATRNARPTLTRTESQHSPRLVLARGELIQQIRAAAEGSADEDALNAELLAAESPARMVRILHHLGYVGTEASVRAIRPLINDARPSVADAAIAALGQIGGTEATGVLIQTVHGTHARGRLAAALALSNVEDPRGLQTLIALARDRRSAIQANAIGALGAGGRIEALPVLRALATGDSPRVAELAVQALAEHGHPDADRFIEQLAMTGDGIVRTTALASLPNVSDPQMLGRLVAMLESGNSDDATAAALALGRSSAPDALSALQACAFTSAQPACIRALAQIGNDRAESTLIDLMRTCDPSTAYETAAALTELGTPEAIEVLRDISRGSDPRKREIALSALIRIGGAETEALMGEVVEHGSTQERMLALRELVMMGNADALDRTIELSRSGNPEERMHALDVLAMTGTEQAQEVIRDIARNGSPDSRIRALSALAYAPIDEDARVVLFNALDSRRPDEVGTAAMILARSGDQAARDRLLALLERSDLPGAETVVLAIGEMNGPEVEAALARAARVGTRQARAIALQTLAMKSSPELTAIAGEALHSEDSMLAQTAAFALVQVGSDESRELLRGAVREGTAEQRAGAIMSLANAPNGAGEYAELLIELSQDADPDVRSVVLQTLSQVHSPESTTAFVHATRDESPQVRSSALHALAMRDGDEAATSAILAALEDDDPSVVDAAIYASRACGEAARERLFALLNDPRSSEGLRVAAAAALIEQGAELTEEQRALANPY